MPSPFTSRVTRTALGILVGLAALALPACGGSSKAATPTKITKLGPKVVPAELLGLTVSSESVKQTEGQKRPYIDAIGLYSLRKGPLLEATLEIGRFSKEADYKSQGFKSSVVSQIGATEPKAYRMGTRTVWLTTGRRQSLSVWFQDRYFFILTARDDYPTPRTLLRRALEIKP
ncbi:MAG: hypothetical protein QOG03_362 [Actinomycetota bacterium]|jgi:hypothetical protein|nr:hypothetical protein [Actinomycetota bacterium]